MPFRFRPCMPAPAMSQASGDRVPTPWPFSWPERDQRKSTSCPITRISTRLRASWSGWMVSLLRSSSRLRACGRCRRRHSPSGSTGGCRCSREDREISRSASRRSGRRSPGATSSCRQQSSVCSAHWGSSRAASRQTRPKPSVGRRQVAVGGKIPLPVSDCRLPTRCSTESHRLSRKACCCPSERSMASPATGCWKLFGSLRRSR